MIKYRWFDEKYRFSMALYLLKHLYHAYDIINNSVVEAPVYGKDFVF